MKPLSQGLRLILASWLADATSARPSDLVRLHGLCNYVALHGTYLQIEEFEDRTWDEFSNRAHPFHDNLSDYFADGGRHHLNPERLEWVREQLAL